jgi:hypothetical protein
MINEGDNDQFRQRWTPAVMLVLVQLVGGAGLMVLAAWIRGEFGRVLIGSRFVLDPFISGLGGGLILTGLLTAGGVCYLAVIYSRTVRIGSGEALTVLVMRHSKTALAATGAGSGSGTQPTALPHYMAARITRDGFELWEGGSGPIYEIAWAEVASLVVKESDGVARKISLALEDLTGREMVAVTLLSPKNLMTFESNRERVARLVAVATSFRAGTAEIDEQHI